MQNECDTLTIRLVVAKYPLSSQDHAIAHLFLLKGTGHGCLCYLGHREPHGHMLS